MNYEPMTVTSENVLSIVIVEDEPELRDNLVLGLTSHGFNVRGVGDGRELDAALAEQQIDIVVLDVGLPGEDGLAVAERLRYDPGIGIIMLTAHGTLENRIQGLERGADNYFVKPVNFTELAIAIKNLGRRLEKTRRQSWILQSPNSCLYTPNGTKIPLTAQECILLSLLFAHRGINVSRRDIFSALGLPDDIYSNPRIEVLISRLRSKVKKMDPSAILPLHARHNIGYVFLDEYT